MKSAGEYPSLSVTFTVPPLIVWLPPVILSNDPAGASSMSRVEDGSHVIVVAGSSIVSVPTERPGAMVPSRVVGTAIWPMPRTVWPGPRISSPPGPSAIWACVLGRRRMISPVPLIVRGPSIQIRQLEPVAVSFTSTVPKFVYSAPRRSDEPARISTCANESTLKNRELDIWTRWKPSPDEVIVPPTSVASSYCTSDPAASITPESP